MYADLRSFVADLERAGELIRVREPVSPVLDIAAIADIVSKQAAPVAPSQGARANDPRGWDRGGPALLFENVEGSSFTLLINAYGSYARMERVLGCTPGGPRDTAGRGFDEVGAIIGELVKPQPPRSLGEVIAKAKQFAPLLKIGPKRVKTGPVHEVVLEGDAIDLTTLPLLRCWAHDGDYAALGYPGGINDAVPGLGHPGIDADSWESSFRGRYITLAGIHTIHAEDAGEDKPSSHNIGMYRVQLLGKNRLAMHWHVHHDGASHWRSWKKRGEPMPVAIALGGEAVLPYAATAPLPPGISELLMAGFLNGKGIGLTRGKTVPLWVPANAEIVIEGYVRHDAGPIGWDPRETDEPLGDGAVFEGPFGDHTGFYSMPDRYPVVEVTAVTHRRDAIYPTTVVGAPPQEDYFLGKATERVFFPLLKTLIHDIEDYDLPAFGAFHNCASIKIGKAYPLQGRRVMHSVWGAGQMAWTKTIFVVDDAVDVHDHHAVLRAAAEHCRPGRDIERVHGPLDILDHAAPRLGAGMKLGFDCTPRWDGEQAGLSVEGPLEATRPMLHGEARQGYLEAIRGLACVEGAALPESLGGWLFVSINKAEPGGGRAAIREVFDVPCETPPPFLIVVDASTGVDDPERVLFEWCANCDASRDSRLRKDPAFPRLGFDATAKTKQEGSDDLPVRAWPPALSHDIETRDRAIEVLKNTGVQIESE